MGSENAVDCDDKELRLETARLTLRRPRMADATELAALANDWDVAGNLSRMPHPYGRSDAEDFIPKARENVRPDVTFFVTNRDTGILMGCCSLWTRASDREFEIGYWFGRPFWGQGFATEAAHRLIDHAFGTVGIDRLWVSCRVTNERSRRVIRNCGFQPDGPAMLPCLALGGPVPGENYSLDRATWRALRDWSGGDGHGVR